MYLTIDGMMSGTGIRDSGLGEGGYLEPLSLGLSEQLCARILQWLGRYEHAHFEQYRDKAAIEQLDAEGVTIARLVVAEVPKAKVLYFSSARLEEIPI